VLITKTNKCTWMDVILLHSGHRHVSTTHVAFFKVVRIRIKYICIDSTLQLTIIYIWLKINLSGKTAISKISKVKNCRLEYGSVE